LDGGVEGVECCAGLSKELGRGGRSEARVDILIAGRGGMG
jgi:hypothetical protein